MHDKHCLIWCSDSLDIVIICGVCAPFSRSFTVLTQSIQQIEVTARCSLLRTNVYGVYSMRPSVCYSLPHYS